MASFEKAIVNTFKAEGGFQAKKNDKANYVNGKLIGTNRGISAQAYYTYYKRVPTVADMKALTVEQAKMIFKGNYWDKVAGDLIVNQSVAEMMFQYIIGSGASQLSDIKDRANEVAGKWVLLSNDHPISRMDAIFINDLDQAKLHANMKAWRFGHYNRVVAASIAAWENEHGRKITEKEALTETKKEFLKGWQNRLNTHIFKP